MLILSIILGILLFMFLVIIHELGHFTAAKKLGVKVLEFGLGIPPKAKKIGEDKSGTEYTLNWIPLGGFVRLRGENPEDKDDFNASDSFMSANIFKKTIILLGGIFMNFLFAWILLTGLYIYGTKPFMVVPENIEIKSDVHKDLLSKSLLITNYSNLKERGFIANEYPILVENVLSGSLAFGKLRSGDIIKTLNGKEILSSTLQKKLSDNFGKKITIGFIHNGESENIQIQCPKNNCTLGILTKGPEIVVKLPIVSAMSQSLKEIYLQVSATFKIMGKLGKNLITFKGSELKQQVKGFSGPIGIIKIFSDIFSSFDWQGLLMLGALISIALGAFNLLPIPALDGGRLLGVLIQKVFFIPKEKYFIVENYINIFFFVILMIFGVYIMLKDLNVFWGIGL